MKGEKNQWKGKRKKPCNNVKGHLGKRELDAVMTWRSGIEWVLDSTHTKNRSVGWDVQSQFWVRYRPPIVSIFLVDDIGSGLIVYTIRNPQCLLTKSLFLMRFFPPMDNPFLHCSSRALTTLVCPCKAATCKAVWPFRPKEPATFGTRCF